MDALRKSGFGRPHDSLMQPLKERCTSSLGLKEKMDQDAQAGRTLTAAFQAERERFIEKLHAAFGAKNPDGSVRCDSCGDPSKDPWDRLGGDLRLGLSRTPSEETRKTIEAMQQEMASIKAAQDEQWKAVNASRAENESKIESCQQTIPLPVKFQFILSADKKKFNVQFIDEGPFGGAEPNRILAFVYQ